MTAVRRIELPSPHPGQIAVRNGAKRFNWLSAGRRWRKTTLVMAIAAEAVLNRKQIIWGAPVYDQVYTGWLETKRAAGSNFDFNTSRMEARAPGGGSIIYRSLDNPDNVRSKTADGVVIDEAGAAQGEAWHEVLRPMLIDTGGWAWIIGTPDGMNWFYDGHEAAKGMEDSASWQAPTLGVRIENNRLIRSPHPLENPNIQFSELLSLYETMPEESFRQEILAEFIADSGAVFRGVKEAATATPQEGFLEHHIYYVGVDLAKEKDFTVITVIDVTTSELVYIDRFNQVDYLFQIDRLKVVCERFCPAAVTVEETGNLGVIEMMWGVKYFDRKLGKEMELPLRPFKTTNASKTEAVQALALAFERKQLRILNNPVLVRELLAFSRKKLELSGLIQYGAPSGQNDDCAMSLVINWVSARYAIGQESLDLVTKLARKLESVGYTEENRPTDPALSGNWSMSREYYAGKFKKEIEKRPVWGYGQYLDED